MTTILDHPIRVDREAERISVFNGGATLDVNGNEQLRREAMRFYERSPAAFRLLLALYNGGAVNRDDAGTVLREAGVLP